MSDQTWLYLDAAGQQQGPVTADQLQALAQGGHLTSETNVWTEGLEQWVPASQVEGLIPAQPAVAPVQAAPVQAAPVNPYAPAATPAAAAPQAGGDYPIPLINKINFRLYVGCVIGGFILYLIAMFQIMGSSPTAEEMATNPNALEESGSIGLGVVLLILGFIALITAAVIQLITIYRAWLILRPGGGTVSPGQAVGFLFIPLFGPIWMIIILCKLPGEWNNIVSRYQNTAAAPRLSIGVVICLLFIPVIGQILWMNELSKAINFMVTQRLTMPHAQATQAAPGGLNLY